MKIRCKNCGTEHDSNFCPNCGTPNETKDIKNQSSDSSPENNEPKKGKAKGIMLNIFRWVTLAFFAIMLIGSVSTKAWVSTFLVILAILVISPLNKFVPISLPKALYGITALVLFIVAIYFYPLSDQEEKVEKTTPETKVEASESESVTEVNTIDKKTQKKITKIEKYITNEKYEKAMTLLSELEAPKSEKVRLYSMYYTVTEDYEVAEKTLYDYCSQIDPLSDAEQDPLYAQLLALYDKVPGKQEELDLLKHNVYVSKIGPEKGHEWEAATCTTPRTCKVCGKEDGKPLGHDWVEATCTEAKKCIRCNEKEGSPLGHDVEEWKVTQKPTCSEEGIEKGICSRCGEEVEQSVAKTDHTPGKWEITRETTSASSPGEKSLLCKVCGEVIEKESYTITKEEELKIYKSSFESVSYENLARYPDSYKDKRVKITVKITDEMEEKLIMFKPYMAKMGGQDIALSDGRSTKEPKLLKGDTVTVYGVGDGTETLKTQRVGIIFNKTIDSREIPMVKILYCEIK